jgi:bacterioferritin-associated ferredoxin
MIVCSCNVLSDQNVRSAVAAERTHSTSRVYGLLGCSAQCGLCARIIRNIMAGALGSARDPATAARGPQNVNWLPPAGPVGVLSACWPSPNWNVDLKARGPSDTSGQNLTLDARA